MRNTIIDKQGDIIKSQELYDIEEMKHVRGIIGEKWQVKLFSEI